MNRFLVDVLTPSKVIARDIPAESLLIPTVRGQINVLPDHTHIVTKLSTGELTIFGGADDPNRSFSVTYGVCRVLNDRVVILSNATEEQSEINYDRAKVALDHATAKLASESLSDDELVKFQRKAERARLRMQLASAYGKRA
jgi:F-type H+-transporting ATPase subunit epsilon